MSSDWIAESLRAVISDMGEARLVTKGAVDGYKGRIELMCTDLFAKEALAGRLHPTEAGALDCLKRAYKEMDMLLDKLLVDGVASSATFQAPLLVSGAVGRPAYVIPEEQLHCLIECCFTVPQISHLLGVSVSTVRRRMSSLNLSIQSTYSQLSDGELDAIVSSTQQHHPSWGNRQMYTYCHVVSDCR